MRKLTIGGVRHVVRRRVQCPVCRGERRESCNWDGKVDKVQKMRRKKK